MITYSSLEQSPEPKVPKFNLKKVLLIVSVVIIIIFGGLSWLVLRASHGTKSTAETKSAKPAGFNKKQYSLDQASSIWVVVNKQRPLNPKDYVPQNLRVPSVPLRLSSVSPEMHLTSDAAGALEKLFAGAQSAGYKLRLSSGYRPYSEQQALFNQYVAQQGMLAAEKESAHPGFSEHQTGLAADVSPADGRCVVQQCFAKTPEGIWLAANAGSYGFIIRYQEGKEAITGYEFEPWHVRYVGINLAVELHKTNQTLEEFFGLPAASDY